jgi:hypothetical protein
VHYQEKWLHAAWPTALAACSSLSNDPNTCAVVPWSSLQLATSSRCLIIRAFRPEQEPRIDWTSGHSKLICKFLSQEDIILLAQGWSVDLRHLSLHKLIGMAASLLQPWVSAACVCCHSSWPHCSEMSVRASGGCVSHQQAVCFALCTDM